MSNLQLPNNFKNYKKLVKILQNSSFEDFERKGEKRALKLFHMMAERVPAYKDFLKKNKVNPDSIKDISDFKRVPTTDKNNYLHCYPLEKLSWDGKLDGKQLTICTTSGSTGEPFYFPHEDDQDWQYLILVELYLRSNFDIDKKSTLYINGFPMGAWIGGTFTHGVIQRVAKKGNYDLSIISPGIHKEEVIKSVLKLGDKFDQIIIGAYGPFLKDIIDEGEKKGINWKKYELGLIFSAEGFTEDFRNYICKKAGIKDPIRHALNHYGTVDLGTMSYETPISVLTRRMAVKNKCVLNDLWGKSIKLPTLTQYIPELFYFESVNGKLICSAFSGLPLVRYDLKDTGGLASFSEIKEIFKKNRISLLKEIKELGVSNTLWDLPFVWVFERDDFSVSLYAFHIHPTTIRKIVQKNKYKDKVTGKFVMMVTHDRNQDQQLEIHVELKPKVKFSRALETSLVHDFVAQLNKDSSEYRETYRTKGEKMHPKITFWSYEHPTYFAPGIKQKWVLENKN